MSTGGVVLSPLAASQQQQQPEPFATSLPLNDVRVGANDWYNVTASIRNAIVAFAEHLALVECPIATAGRASEAG